ncbi:MAG: UDP-2,3-diacylglucosamine diphosphatase [Gammaproteobacteria bacterium]|nr:MAG: UDP-2,3-diacylglucosamine diphosphatase [Gammaproteobacteria bacterium]
MATLFISDLHLSPQRPQIIQLFFQFLQKQASAAEALYILGDFFEFWIGDDAGLGPEYQPVNQALQQFTASGIPVFFMGGNRDFLVGRDWAAHVGVQLMQQETVIDLYGERVLLLHGDSLTTDDEKQQAFRNMVMDPQWQAMFLSKPIPERLEMAQQARLESQKHQSGMHEEIMDVNTDAVAAVMRKHGVTRLIHGHTHRPHMHELMLDGKPAQRIVLADWYERGNVLQVRKDRFELNYFDAKQSGQDNGGRAVK